MSYWYGIVYAPTREDFLVAFNEMKAKYEHTHREQMKYLKKIWLDSWLGKFCKYKINKILHFNTLTIFRVEGDHRVLKHMLKFSTGDLLTVVMNIEVLLKNQHENYTTKLDLAKMRIAANLPREEFSHLIGRVSPYCLQKIRKQ